MEHVKNVFCVRPIEIDNLVSDDSIDDLPRDWQSFHDYPKRNHWALNHEFELGFNDSTEPTGDLATFLQAWLFYGLIFTVVQKNQKPILCYENLNTGHNGSLSTRTLAKALDDWKDWENNNPSGRVLRMVRAEKVLDIARRTIRRMFSCENDSHRHQPPSNDRYHVSDQCTLLLMTLGEALSAAKSVIMQETGSELGGWHYSHNEGWGEPRFVIQRMEDHKWCPRTMHMWRSQLQSNATLLLAAYYAYADVELIKGNEHMVDIHPFLGTRVRPRCTKDNCSVVLAEDKTGHYNSKHAYGCHQSCCELAGPDMESITAHLEKDKIPLLMFETDEEQDVRLIETSWLPKTSKPPEYATISHVWSDGFGNETENKLPVCQLQLIRRQLALLSGWRTPFWMDTLILPVQKTDNAKAMRKRGIEQIFTVFKESKYTLVLDAGLVTSLSGSGSPPSHSAMRVLLSSWMRRLWTLQEGFLSKKIHFVFTEGERTTNRHLLEFGTLSERLDAAARNLPTALLTKVSSYLRHNIINHETNTRDTFLFDQSGDLPPRRASELVANIWKAARWRTTTNHTHESMALAALLGLEFGNTPIGDKGLMQINPSHPKDGKTNRSIERERDELMRAFWTLFNEKWKKSIPPGIIFLPGDKIEHRGFGWAPRTWMAANPTDPPDPLSNMGQPAELDSSGLAGLKVRYPGFLFSPDNSHLIRSIITPYGMFWFPAGPSFLDWYVVKAAGGKNPNVSSLWDSDAQFAIILSRPRPSDDPAEIGLLVKIRKVELESKYQDTPAYDSLEVQRTTEEYHRGETSNTKQKDRVFYCIIVDRVKVSREPRTMFREVNRGRMMRAEAPGSSTMPLSPTTEDEEVQEPHVPEIMVNTGRDNEILLAEELSSDQAWYVDSLPPIRGQKPPVSSAIGKVASGCLASLRNRTTT
ncbi:hypothetical protein PGQ11_002533 [Apiospora arundinis]|uniref:Heterokaryon incompatibility domain-containing protein n=1 Tax=Apiospora arundinis TaxID=335852 RepID=A0ABR2JIF5_9PEZI